MDFPGKKGLCQFLDIPIIYLPIIIFQKSEKVIIPYLRKTSNWRTDGQVDNGDFIGSFVGRRSNNKTTFFGRREPDFT